MLRSAEAITTADRHEETFLARYERLLGWALQLTGGDREQAEDLVHDAFIQFTFSRPDLAAIHNLDGYLYTVLRNLRLSQLRRRQHPVGRSLSALEYDSAELSLRSVDPRDQIRVQDELRQICRYACLRKETSKAGSVLLLRFMLGYYPREIAEIMRATRQAAEERLRVARGEARLFLENPAGLHFIGSRDAVSVGPEGYARTTEELLHDLRRAVFNSCRGDCLTAARLAELYSGANESAVEAETLAHIVSCPRCLDAVNRLLGLPLLAERYPTDTLGTDTRPKGGGGGGGTSGAGREQAARRCRRRARETFEHRPRELRISVNGYVMASQSVGAPLSEQELSVAADERIDFVEVLSEQEVRLLFLCVDEPPPAGPHSRSVKVELSEGRHLEATLSFSSPWPTVRIAYSDPEAEVTAATREQHAAVESSLSSPAAASSVPAQADEAAGGVTGRRRVWRRLAGTLADALRGLARPGFWLRPGPLTAAMSLVIVCAALLYFRWHEPTVSAAQLLARSTAAEQAAAADAGLVLHRTISLEARRPGAVTPVRSRIEVWQSAARGEKVRRVYDEQGRLLAGVWESSGGAATVYRRGGPARKEADAAPALLSADDIWRVDLSADDFSALVGGATGVSAEERADGYVLSHAGRPGAMRPRVARATLVLSKADLRAIEQTLVVEGPEGEREYRFVETGFSRQRAASVDPAVFRPEPELSGDSRGTEGRSGDAAPSGVATGQPTAADASVSAGTPAVASAELEIEVNYLLDQIRANLGEQVTVGRTTGGKLRVEALVETERRKEEILRALGPVLNNPAVVAQVSTVEEAVRRQKSKATDARGEDVEEVDVETRRIPADDDLRRHFSARLADGARIDEEIERFAQRQMGRSRQALMHANALRQLAARFSPEEVRSLAPEARAKWQTMIRQHARGYREQVSALRRELRAVFSPGASGEADADGVGDETLRRDAERLLRLSYAHDEAVRAAFTLSDAARAPVALRSQQFWRSLAAAEALAEAMEAAHRERRE
ncbi:MAG TPA: sigma-70 family RNA polymerase sigma factor [Pyrinomonadaceae bacterium]|nr:sigma-70 family RNA polymerase sigma factor [Pyrinomonadaceae bacterium]